MTENPHDLQRARATRATGWRGLACLAALAAVTRGRLLVVSRFDRGPRPVGHARTLHIDVGTDDGIDTDADRDTGFDTNSDSDSDAATDADTDGGGAIRGERPVPLTLGKHQLRDVHVRAARTSPAVRSSSTPGWLHRDRRTAI